MAVLLPSDSSALLPPFLFSFFAIAADLHSSLHDALPIFATYLVYFHEIGLAGGFVVWSAMTVRDLWVIRQTVRSEEHTSELQSRFDLVCRLLLVKQTHVQIQRRRPRESPKLSYQPRVHLA